MTLECVTAPGMAEIRRYAKDPACFRPCAARFCHIWAMLTKFGPITLSGFDRPSGMSVEFGLRSAIAWPKFGANFGHILNALDQSSACSHHADQI